MSHYPGSCPPGQHCCLCAEDALKQRLATAHALLRDATRGHAIDWVDWIKRAKKEVGMTDCKHDERFLYWEDHRQPIFCTLCEMDRLKAKLAAAEAQLESHSVLLNEFAWHVQKAKAGRDGALTKLAAAEARIFMLQNSTSSRVFSAQLERDEARTQLAAAEARVAELESRPIKNMRQIVREFSETEPAKKEVGE